MFAFLMHRWVRKPSRGPNILYVYEPQQNLGRGLRLSSWLCVRSDLILCRLYCMCSFPVWCLGEDMELDCIGR